MLITGYKCVCTDGTDVTSSIVFNSTSGKWISRDRMYKNPSYSSDIFEYIAFTTYDGNREMHYTDTKFYGSGYAPTVLKHDNCRYIFDTNRTRKTGFNISIEYNDKIYYISPFLIMKPEILYEPRRVPDSYSRYTLYFLDSNGNLLDNIAWSEYVLNKEFEDFLIKIRDSHYESFKDKYTDITFETLEDAKNEIMSICEILESELKQNTSKYFLKLLLNMDMQCLKSRILYKLIIGYLVMIFLII